MKKYLRIILLIIFGLSVVFVLMQSVKSEEPISTNADFNFIKWSNNISVEDAETQLKRFFSSNFNSWEEAETWLAKQGFRLEKPLLTPENTAEIYGFDNNLILFTAVAGWSPKRQGIIFANNLIIKIESKLFVSGVNIGFLYSKDPFSVYRVNITKTRL